MLNVINKKYFKQGILFIVVFLFSSISLLAQKGSITGVITDASNGEGLPGASVVIEGTVKGATTNLEGTYVITDLDPGTYNLHVSYIGFLNGIIKGITVESATPVKASLALKENANQLSGAEIVSNRISNTENAVLMDIKRSEQIVNGISGQQIARSQDRTAVEVIRRMPGVTIMENGFVLIRGLSERYNTILLNGIIAPSLEADKKAFSLDVIPGSLLDRILIYKTGAPELPGEFAGGIVSIVTKNIPDENQFAISYTAGIRENTTFRDFYQAPKGNKDWLGTDDGTRSLPSNFPSSLYNVNSSSQLTGLGRQLPNAWTAAKIQAVPDQKFSATLARNFKLGKVKTGNLTSVQHGITYDSYDAKNFSYNSYDVESQKSDTIYSYNDRTFKENVKLSVIHNWSFLITPSTKIEFRNFFNQQGSNQAIIRDGSNYEEGSLVRSYAYRYQQRTVYSGQLHGSHDMLAGRTKVEWIGAYSWAHSAEPDFRRIRTKKDLYATSDSIPYQVIIAPSASTIDAGRFYSDLLEQTYTVTGSVEHHLKPMESEKLPKIRGGFYSEYKVRDFNARWMSYKQSNITMFDNNLLYLPLDQIFAPENINDTTGFKLEEGTNPSDRYDAYNTHVAGFAGLSWPFNDKFNMSGGLRVEYNNQQLESRTYADKPINVDNTVISILPSVNTSYNITQKSLIRFAYSRSVNRPEFRELAPFWYYDFTFNNLLTGNPALKTPEINNYDLRWELYPSAGEMLSIAGFYKEFTNPIEMFFIPGAGSGGTRNFTFDNAEKARSFGAEIELKKGFASLYDSTNSRRNSFLRKLISRSGISFNAAWIDSKVILGDKAVGQSSDRPMMGQSPFIINAGLFYSDIDHKVQVSALYNIIGKRIFAVGTYGTPDIYYMPRNSFDLTVTKGFGKYLEIKGGVQDLLSQDEVYSQDSDENGTINSRDEDILIINRGASYTLGVQFKF